MSSASVLFILQDYLHGLGGTCQLPPSPPPAALGLMMALGPAFCAEFTLLRTSPLLLRFNFNDQLNICKIYRVTFEDS